MYNNHWLGFYLLNRRFCIAAFPLLSYSVMQSDGNSFRVEVILDSFNMASEEEDKISDQIASHRTVGQTTENSTLIDVVGKPIQGTQNGGAELSNLFHNKTFFPVYVYFLTASSVTCHNTAELGGLELGFPAVLFKLGKESRKKVLFIMDSQLRGEGVRGCPLRKKEL